MRRALLVGAVTSGLFLSGFVMSGAQASEPRKVLPATGTVPEVQEIVVGPLVAQRTTGVLVPTGDPPVVNEINALADRKCVDFGDLLDDFYSGGLTGEAFYLAFIYAWFDGVLCDNFYAVLSAWEGSAL